MVTSRNPRFARLALIAILAAGILLWANSEGRVNPSVTAQEEELPTDLVLTLAPPIVLADGNSEPLVYLQLLDDEGIPRLATEAESFRLASSDSNVATLPSVIEIPPGRS